MENMTDLELRSNNIIDEILLESNKVQPDLGRIEKLADRWNELNVSESADAEDERKREFEKILQSIKDKNT